MLVSPLGMEKLPGPDPRLRPWTRVWAGLCALIWLGPGLFLLGLLLQPTDRLLNTAIVWYLGLVPVLAVGHLVATVGVVFLSAAQPEEDLNRPRMWWRWAIVALELLLALSLVSMLLHVLAPASFPFG